MCGGSQHFKSSGDVIFGELGQELENSLKTGRKIGQALFLSKWLSHVTKLLSSERVCIPQEFEIVCPIINGCSMRNDMKHEV